MYKDKELVVYYDKNIIRNGYIYVPIVIGMAIYMYYSGVYILWDLIANLLFSCGINLLLINNVGYYLIVALQFLIISFVVLILLAFMYNLFLFKSNTPILILNHEGIFAKRFGLIPWNNIIDVTPYLGMPSSLGAIEVQIKNTSLLYEQATVSGKLSIFFSKQFGHSPLIIANIILDSHIVLSFARQCINKRNIHD